MRPTPRGRSTPERPSARRLPEMGGSHWLERWGGRLTSPDLQTGQRRPDVSSSAPVPSPEKRMPMRTTPPRQGLYDPTNEHDACGVAFVVDLQGRRTHDLVEKGIAA